MCQAIASRHEMRSEDFHNEVRQVLQGYQQCMSALPVPCEGKVIRLWSTIYLTNNECLACLCWSRDDASWCTLPALSDCELVLNSGIWLFDKYFWSMKLLPTHSGPLTSSKRTLQNGLRMPLVQWTIKWFIILYYFHYNFVPINLIDRISHLVVWPILHFISVLWFFFSPISCLIVGVSLFIFLYFSNTRTPS